MEKKFTYREAAERAMQVQDACNLSGVVRDFAAITSAVWEEARRRGKGTDWVNTHPIHVLFVSKLADLSRYAYGDDVKNFGQAEALCQRILAGETDVP